jgi:hypothetical protein
VYLADQDIAGVFELYLEGSGTKLNPALAVGRTITSFALTPDAAAVVYIADQDQDDVFEFTASISRAPVPARSSMERSWQAGTWCSSQ